MILECKNPKNWKMNPRLTIKHVRVHYYPIEAL